MLVHHVHFEMSLESGIWTTSASEQETGSVKVDLELGFRCPLCPGVSNDSKWYELPQAELFYADPLHLPPPCEGSADTAAEEQEQQWTSSSAKGLRSGECSFGSIHQSWHSNKRSCDGIQLTATLWKQFSPSCAPGQQRGVRLGVRLA